jgi:diguanylate cyclase (GGDEF)-like protein
MKRIALPGCALLVCGVMSGVVRAAGAPSEPRAFERGFPLVATYTAKQHQGGTQVFAATQDRTGVLYFGTLRGVMSYDGAWWRHTTLPNGSAVFAVAARSGPEIAVGGVDEFGWVGPDASGERTYHSLVAQLPPSMRDIGDVRGVCATPNAFVFVAEQRVIAWSGGAPRVVATLPASTSPTRCFTAGRAVYLGGANGLQRLDPVSMTLARAGFDGKTIDAVVPFDESRVLVAVRGEGLFVSDGVNAIPFATEALPWLREKIVTAGCRLSDGRFVIGTRQDGVLLLTSAGALQQRLDSAAGLPLAVLANAFEDREGSLWLTYHGPIVRIDLATPVSLIDTRSGLRGSVNAISRDHDRLWIATSHGLFVSDRTTAADAPPVRVMPDVPAPTWASLPLDGELLAGTTDGAYLIGPDQHPRRIAGTEGMVVYEALRSTSDPSRVWLGLRKGIATLRQTASGWTFEGIIAGSPPHARTLVERDGVLWLGTTFDGVVRLELKDGSARMQTIGPKREAHVAEIDGRIVDRTDDAYFTVMPNGALVRDAQLSAVAGDAFLIAEDARGNLWLNTTPPRFLPRLANGHYAREPLPLVAVDPAGIAVLQVDTDGVVWFGSDQALYRFENSEARAAAAQPAPVIPRVTRSGGLRVTGPLPHAFTRLRIEFAPLSYRPGVAFQSRLDPADAAWSAWSPEPFIDYTSLAPGRYTFRVRARSAWGNVSDETQWSFSVLPPWYRTRWAMLLWLAIAALLVAAIVRIRTSALRRQAARLQALVEERTDDLRQANAQLERLSLLDELTGIANRRYFQRALTEDWQQALEERKPLALVLLDLDHFKKLNDERGHLEGDAALVHVGRFLARQIRRSSGELPSRITDIVARIGGEEFAVLLSNTTVEEAMRTAERLRAGIESLPIGITVSCGVASMFPTHPEAWNALIDRADRALYAAKDAGRNCARADENGGAETTIAM